MPQAIKNELKEYLTNLVKRAIIRRSNSEWRNPIRAIQKPNGKLRIISNFMSLNDLCEKDPYVYKIKEELLIRHKDTNLTQFWILKMPFNV